MTIVPEYSVLELCRNRAGYEAVPKARMSLDLATVEKRLAGVGFEPLVNAGIITVLRFGLVELSVFESGKLLFKTRNRADAQATMAAFRAGMGWAPVA